MPANVPLLAGIDTGGTFTDVVVLVEGRLRHCKVLSTPADPSQAIFEGLDRLGVSDRAMQIIHGTTVGTNAVLEGKGARVAYVTSEGFADVLTLARQNREDVYSLRQPDVEPPVPPGLCFELPTRISADGSLLGRASGEELDQLVQDLEALAPESVAINLIFSFLRPAEEQRVAERLEGRFFVSCSSRVLPETREFERGIATWLDASVGPVISRYLKRLQQRLPAAGISVMQSSGTSVAAEQAASQAVRLLLSGPAGGLAAARLAGEVTGQKRLLTIDMGGTSTDVALLDGEIPLSQDCRIGNWPLTIVSVDIHTIGAGGGSIARTDRGGLLMVGPESAGAEPGPACYGRGGIQTTVTDANLELGRIPHDTLLGGYLPLYRELAKSALDDLAENLKCGRLNAARGVIRLANEHMARALRVISVERGHDPRNYTLFCFGGAGGLHACELAELLEIPEIMLPARAGVLSAQGMLASEPGRDLSRAVLQPLADTGDPELAAQFSILEAEAAKQLAAEGIAPSEITFRRQLELRYLGQSSGIVLPFQPGQDHAATFHQAHERSSGHRLDQVVELVNFRLGARAGAPVSSMEPLRGYPAASEPKMAYMADLKCTVPVFDRKTLSPGFAATGPAIVSEKAATSWIAPGWKMRVDEWGNLHLRRNASAADAGQ